MSVFTMTLQEAWEFNTYDESRLKYFGLDTFPIAKEFEATKDLFRETLGDKIIDHYWNREIGLESFSMWRFNFRRLLNEQMPYYNKLYASELIKFDPLSTMQMTTSGKGSQQSDSEGESDSTAATKANARAIASQFPQTQFNAINGNYGESGNDSLATSENTANGKDSRKDNVSSDSSSTSSGYAGAASSLLTEYRSTLLNIDMLVIDRCEECFMQVLGTGDTFTGNGVLL